jgi:hypothetical protein
MKKTRFRYWMILLLMTLGVHFVYLSFIMVGAGSLATKKGVETVLTAMNFEDTAKYLTMSVFDMAFEQVVVNTVDSQVQMQRSLAAEEPPKLMPSAFKNFRGRGLLSDEDVIDMSAVESEIQNMNFGIMPDAVDFPEDVNPQPQNLNIPISP